MYMTLLLQNLTKLVDIFWQPISDFINELPNNSLIYDIGCGNGINMTYNNHKFIGVDNCQKFVDICKNNGLDAICNT